MTPVPQRVSRLPAQLHVLFDGDCRFCRFWIERWRAQVRERTRFDPYQETGRLYPEIPSAAFGEAVQAIDPHGRVYSGADAVFRLLQSTGWRWLAKVADAAPLFRKAAHVAYRFVAEHRSSFSLLTRLGWGMDPRPPTFAVARRIFAHGLGFVFFTAFGALVCQWQGLAGSGGIAPVEAWLGPLREKLGSAAYLRVPSVFWMAHSDGAMMLAAWLGLLISVAMVCGYAPGACALSLWALYLSFCSFGEPFMSYQWDALLLETALLAAVYLPWSLRPTWRLTARLTTLGRWLLWWLLCRLMLESGIVKLASGDPTWRNLTALTYHYQTQPLPLWTAWFAHQAPVWIHKLEALGTFAIEFIAPLLMFGPRRLRHVGAWAMIVLQTAIMVTGNYAFFNLLCILLSLLLLEDAHWPVSWRLRLLRRARPPFHVGESTTASWILEPLGFLSALLTGLLLWRTFARGTTFPEPIRSVLTVTAPLESFNSYGLFAVMTTQRREIAVEGSADGEHWQEYGFKWKPGALDRRPRLAEPYQPRLDWQMWFAALSEARREPWFLNFLGRLLMNSPDVLALLEWNPFPGTPPKFIRAQLYEYRFTRFGEQGWWTRELLGEYCPAVSLSEKPPADGK